MMRGIDSRHEIDPTQLLRDTRTVGQRLGDFFQILPMYPLYWFHLQVFPTMFQK